MTSSSTETPLMSTIQSDLSVENTVTVLMPMRR